MKIQENKSQEVVLQSNQISQSLYYCSATARKIIAFASQNLKTEEHSFKNSLGNEFCATRFYSNFSIGEMLDNLGLTDCGKNYEIAQNAIIELMESQIHIKDDDTYTIYNWFSKAVYNEKSAQIELDFTFEVGLALQDFFNGYSALKLKTIGALQSSYSIGFYELAESYQGFKGKDGNKKNQWFWQMTIDEIRAKFQIKESAYKDRPENFIKYVISNPIEKLNKENDEFQIEVIKIKERRKTIGFKFVCTETTKKYEIKNTMSKTEKNERAEINREEQEKNALIKKYQDEYNEILDFKKHEQPMFKEMPLLAENDAYLELKKRHSK